MWKVSLLVTTYNTKDNLEVILENIEAQDYADIEVLIVDGKSTDGTVDIIREFANRHQMDNSIDHITVRWICIGAHADLVYMAGEHVVRTWHMDEGKLSQGWTPGHPTLFLKREVYERYGLYDISYRNAADYEFMVRFLKDEKNQLACARSADCHVLRRNKYCWYS